ncbi:ammonium transporter A [Microthyrium microscopicum]|uniref:Ammonium transporter A n=1 Tax=Microthyrium microscopicum TaxID=703497 RepID=A0A6A6UKS9_9PEZI|nr:ammonium transporter A [Microthyrium microscopicum]
MSSTSSSAASSSPTVNPLAPDWLDKGDNAWQLTAATLVGLQSVPGLVVLYAGWVKHKWAINSAFMAFYAFCAVLIAWVVWAYKAAFGNQMLPFVGVPGPAVEMTYELKQAVLPAANISANFPQSTMVYFQFVFAAITVILIAGSFLCRMNIYAWIFFVPLWLTFSYTVGAFSLWGGGFLFQRGVIDYSGGYVIHLSAGTAGFVGAWWIGPRIAEDLDDATPNNIIMMMTGAGLLWLGWNGFNGGDPYAASPDAGAAVLNTNICTAFSSIVWMAMDVAYFRRPSVIGAIQGMITGLVAITPAAGVVAGWGAIILGLGSAVIPWITLNLGKRHIGILQRVDDTLDVFHTHFVASLVGGFGVGLFATESGCAAFACIDAGGAEAGVGKQVWLQIVGALFIIGWNIVWTSLIMMFIKYVLRIPLRMTDEACRIGDYHIHQEESYTFAYYNRSLLEGHDMEAGVAKSSSGDEISPVAKEKTGEGKQD